MKKVLLSLIGLSVAVGFCACAPIEEPPTTTDVPVVTTAEPVVTTAEPVVTTEEPVVTTAEPVVTTADTSVSLDYVTEPVPVETTEPEYTGEFDPAKSDLSEYIELGKYLGIEVFVKGPEPVDQTEVDARVEAALAALPEEAMIHSRAAMEGDKVSIDFVGRIDGEEFDGGSATGYNVVLGSGSLIEGFEDGIVGMLPGDVFSLDLVFPEDYYYPEFASVSVVFDVTLNYIYPTLTDEIAVNYLDAQSADAYRGTIIAEMEAAANTEFEAAKEEAAWTKALANSRVADYPENLLNEAFESSVAAYVSLAEMYGLTYEEVFTLVYGLSVEEAESILMDSSKNIVAQQLLLYAIARDMGIDVSDERFEEDLEATAAILGLESVDELVEMLGGDKKSLKEDKLYSQIITEIVENANFVVTE